MGVLEVLILLCFPVSEEKIFVGVLSQKRVVV